MNLRRYSRITFFFQFLTTTFVNNLDFITTTTTTPAASAYLLPSSSSSPSNSKKKNNNIAVGSIFHDPPYYQQPRSKPQNRLFTSTIITTGSTTTTKAANSMPLKMTSSSNEEKEEETVSSDVAMDDVDEDDPKSQQQPRRSPRKRKTARGETTTATGTPETATLSSEDDEKESSTPPPPKKKVKKTKAATKRKKTTPKLAAAKKVSMEDEGDDDDDDGDDDNNSIASTYSSSTSSKKTKKKKSTATKKKKSTKTKGVATATTTTRKKESTIEDDEGSVASSSSSSSQKKKKKKSPASKKKKKAAAADHQRITERDEIPKLWNVKDAADNGSYTFKIASWNVAGIRALIRKDPDVLSNLCKEHDLDMLCLQETKLQESHLDDPKLNFRGCLKENGYDDYWSCSTAKKGYSGTAVFIRQRGGTTKGGGIKNKKSKQKSIKGFFAPKKGEEGNDESGSGENNKEPEEAPEPKRELTISSEIVTPTEVSYNIGKEIDNEGRTVIMDFPFATIANVYVPNSGQNLQRLDYRTKEWDNDFLEFMQKRQKERNLPVIWLGDLNIAHKAYDVWNDGAKHLAKQAGVTTQERESFQSQLDSGFVDAFRKLHPEARGHYSYWSQRAGNREPNKGLRLDYFICSPDLFVDENNNEKEDDTSNKDVAAIVRDSYFIKDQLGSDHCPAVLELEIKGEKK